MDCHLLHLANRQGCTRQHMGLTKQGQTLHKQLDPQVAAAEFLHRQPLTSSPCRTERKVWELTAAPV